MTPGTPVGLAELRCVHRCRGLVSEAGDVQVPASLTSGNVEADLEEIFEEMRDHDLRFEAREEASFRSVSQSGRDVPALLQRVKCVVCVNANVLLTHVAPGHSPGGQLLHFRGDVSSQHLRN